MGINNRPYETTKVHEFRRFHATSYRVHGKRYVYMLELNEMQQYALRGLIDYTVAISSHKNTFITHLHQNRYHREITTRQTNQYCAKT